MRKTKYPFFLNPSVQSLVMVSTFIILSVVVVFYALGYQVNWSNFNVRQTSILNFDTEISRFNADIYLNGSLIGTRFPIRKTRVFPGLFHLEIKKDGYQKWEKTFLLEPNKVANFRRIILIKEKPLVYDLDAQTHLDRLNKKDIVIKNNELWLEDKFITRSSEDIQTASWYPDNAHFVYQAGKELWLADLDARSSQKILTLEDKIPLEYGFKENGRILIYRRDGTVKAVELFDRY